MQAKGVNSGSEKTQNDKERRGIILFCAVAAAYLLICSLIYAFTDMNEKNAYVTVSPVPSAGEAIAEEDKLNINTASAEELTSLSGIGDVTAQKIIEYREKYGGFLDTEEIMNVSGIGEKLYKKIKPYITV